MRIAVLGAVALDHYILVESFPEDDSMVFALKEFHTIGGCGANIAINLALNGCETHLFCGIGKDDVATFIMHSLNKMGIQVHCLSEGKTASTIILLDKEGRRRIISLGGNALFHSDGDTRYDEYDVVCVADSIPSEALRALQSSARLKIYVPGGCGLYFGENEIRKVANFSSITVLSANEASKIRKCNEISQWVIVTSGENPTKLYYQGTLVREFAVHSVDNIVDTTGAGDAFVSGLVFSLSRTGDIFTAIEIAHNWAAKVIQKYGANLSYDFVEVTQ
ncbi:MULTISPECIES: carbohydrate kinase family protein [Pseudothermotoga]|jgi:ribokinase|uniref:PfkB domain protein n=1 Tax=Pseudothermotoga lettingae (strain ATCC BAA-301 / DSM 14385 / NBRC 107922 / TMO) TaxID=416591 RepID=A8F872_PSELT|nr:MULTISPECIES: carbohydrate kinase family protein [Pseudothermotoga]ABV34356.1 PfkB domain protein [Pseudothermotoga lettingae TMO]MDI3495583.1 ribokinase [Pseudothermotoga sp.]MDK2885057.1 ribokinase [Pseudothermotoga sp.]GLI48699.1 sugar kinase [Pseudothermotoga lettingae TMO]